MAMQFSKPSTHSLASGQPLTLQLRENETVVIDSVVKPASGRLSFAVISGGVTVVSFHDDERATVGADQNQVFPYLDLVGRVRRPF